MTVTPDEDPALLAGRASGGGGGAVSGAQEIARLRAQLEEAQETIGHLRSALESSRRIGAAVGIVMARYGLSDEDAFALLARRSQNANRRVRDIAEEVIYTGDLGPQRPS